MRYLPILIFFTFVLLFGCHSEEPEGASIKNLSKDQKGPDKKVILVMIDSMTGHLLDQSKERGKIPALQFLMENGQYSKELVSPFPTMSVVIESTLLTGKMPDEHLVPGLVWYNKGENRLIDYGSTVQKMMKLGLKQSMIDGLYHLNNTHLNEQISTIFEVLQERNYTTGSVNMLLYRGNKRHSLQLPFELEQFLNKKETWQTQGPDLLVLGRFVQPKILKDKNLPDSFLSRYGFNDEFSAHAVKEIIKNIEDH